MSERQIFVAKNRFGNKIRLFITCILIFLYGLFFMALCIRNEAFRAFSKRFIEVLKNRELGEALFIVLFFMLPVYLIILVSNKIAEKLKL